MLSIAERRAVSERASEPEFRHLLRENPRKAVEQVIGQPVPSNRKIEVLEEGSVAWSFVLVHPSDLKQGLPEAHDLRSAVENDVYSLLRDDPTMADTIEQDPVAFLRDRFGIEVTAVHVRRESADETLVILPNAAAREQLADDMLDLLVGGDGVSGGGDSGVQNGRIAHKYDNYG